MTMVRDAVGSSEAAIKLSVAAVIQVHDSSPSIHGCNGPSGFPTRTEYKTSGCLDA
jgi:hypothetical protein